MVDATQQDESLERFLTINEIALALRISRAQWYALLQEGGAPPPDAWTGARSPRWKRSTILAWTAATQQPARRPRTGRGTKRGAK